MTTHREEPIVNIYFTTPATEYCQAKYTVKQKPSKCRTKGKYMFAYEREKQGYVTCGVHLKALCDLAALEMDTQPMKPIPKGAKVLGYGDYENMEEHQCQAMMTLASGKEPAERCSSTKTFAFQSEQHNCVLFLCKKHFSWIDNAYDHKVCLVDHSTTANGEEHANDGNEEMANGIEHSSSQEDDELFSTPVKVSPMENGKEPSGKFSPLTDDEENGHLETKNSSNDDLNAQQNGNMLSSLQGRTGSGLKTVEGESNNDINGTNHQEEEEENNVGISKDTVQKTPPPPPKPQYNNMKNNPSEKNDAIATTNNAKKTTESGGCCVIS
eukprot:jgi/Galph1/1604/GphlegSOOS_G292.1